MKTKTRILIGLAILAALCIGFLAGILVNFPPVGDSEAAGTFGKAEKFRKVQMTEKDVQLRSELVRDTLQLRKMIGELVYFTVFTNDLSATLDMTVITCKLSSTGDNSDYAGKLDVLQEYSGFIRNNNQNMNSLIAMLTGFLKTSGGDQSVDVEKNLRDFGAYVGRLTELNGLLNDALVAIDASILGNAKLRENRDELLKVKSIRDQLLVKGIQMGSLISDKEQVSGLISFALNSQNQFSGISGSDVLPVIYVREGVSSFSAANGVNSVISSQELSNVLTGQTIDSKSVFYDSKDLAFSYSRNNNLDRNQGISSKDLNCIASLIGNSINIVCSNYGVSNIISSNSISSSLTKELTGAGIINMENIGNSVNSQVNSQISSQVNSQINSFDLGRIYNNKFDRGISSHQ